MHVYRSHNKNIKEEVLKCNQPNCSYKITCKAELSSHFSQHIKKGVVVKCPLCKTAQQTFNNISTWRSHLCRKHYTFNNASTSNALQSLEQLYDNNSDIVTENAVLYETRDALDDLMNSNENLDSCYLKSLSLLYLTLEAKYFLTQNALNTIVDCFRELNIISNNNITNYFRHSFNINISHELLNELHYFNNIHDRFTGQLRSSFIRKKYFKSEFNFVAPLSIKLGESRGKICNFYYVPLLETLKVLLGKSNIRTQILTHDNNSVDDVFANITDGSVYKNNQYFMDNPTVLRLLLFQDAFEICNVLGSARKKYKIIGIYMNVGNVQPFHWSKVDNISLVALVFERHLNQFGFTKIFDIIVKDIRTLETEGIEVANHIIKGTLFAMLGDNLGSHQIGGFSENFSFSPYICRYCYIKTEDLNTQFDKFKYRSKDFYETDIQIKFATNDSHHRGVKFDSILNSLKYFHVCNPGLPPCLAHDVFEGVVQYDLMLAVNYFIRHDIISLEDLNEHMQKLHLEHHDNLPKMEIKRNSDRLLGNAHENMLFILLLPFAIHHLIEDVTNDVWQMVLKLREICNIILSVKLHIGQIAYLQTLIVEYIELRVTIFPEIRLRPKHHYLLHYPKLLTQFGPLRLLWTLRFESKHKYFKSAIKHCPNFKNVLYSLTEKHQLLQALHLSQQSAFSDNVIADKVVTFHENNYAREEFELIRRECDYYATTFVSKQVEFRAIIYRQNMYICYGKNDYGSFLLLKIKYILINKNYSTISFVGTSIPIDFNPNIGLYEISYPVNNSLPLVYVKHENLLSHEPLYTFKTNTNIFYFYFKSAPFDMINC